MDYKSNTEISNHVLLKIHWAMHSALYYIRLLVDEKKLQRNDTLEMIMEDLSDALCRIDVHVNKIKNQ